MSTTQLVHSYRRLGRVTLQVREIKNLETGTALEAVKRRDDPDFGRRIVDLTASPPWTRIRISLGCDLDATQARECLGEREEPDTVLRVQVVLSSRGAKLRRATELVHQGDHRYFGTLTVRREDVAGAFDLSLKIVRRSELEGPRAPDTAGFIGAVLGESEPVVWYAEEEELPYNGPIRFVWRHFAGSGDERLESVAMLPMLVEAGRQPLVIMNSGIEDYKAVLEGRGGSPAERALRSGLALMIGAAAWRQLILGALCTLAKSDEDPSMTVVEADWRGAIVRSLATLSYPERTPDDAMLALYNDFHDKDSAVFVIEKIGVLADRNARAKNLIADGIRAARRDGEN